MATTPPNNALKLTSFALQGGLSSQLNAVFCGLRQDDLNLDVQHRGSVAA